MKKFKMREAPKKINFVRAVIDFFILNLAFALILFTIFYTVESNTLKIKREELENQQLAQIQVETTLLGRELDYVLSDLQFLVKDFEILTNESQSYEIVSEEWIKFADTKRVYDQIRYIDKEGYERIRIEFNGTTAHVVPERRLQNKKDRDYFQKTIVLKEGQIYMSRLDLNIENGEIEIPIKPTIRFATPVYNGKSDESQGIIVLNFMAEKTLTEYRNLPRKYEANQFLLDPAGYWLVCDEPENEWGFMYEDRQDVNFKNQYPKAWEQMGGDSGLFLTEKGLYAFSKIFFEDKFVSNSLLFKRNRVKMEEGSWIAVSFIPEDGPYGYVISSGFIDISRTIIKRNAVYFISLLVLAGILAVLIYAIRVSRQRILFYSMFDKLTHAYNRGAGIDIMKERLPKDSKRKTGVSMNFIDVNGLKQVNDNLGHVAGDELIVTVAACIKKEIREDDMLVRMGGDEFLIALCGIDKRDSEAVWQRITARFDKINNEEQRPYTISVSHGIIEIDQWDNHDIDELIKKADERMYEEKKRMKAGLNVIRGQ